MPDIPSAGTGVLRQAVRAVRGMGRVLRLVWAASPRLTIALGVASVVTGLVPALTAATTRVLVNAVVGGVAARLSEKPMAPLDVRLPGFAFHLWPMAATSVVLVVAVTQLVVFQLSALANAVRTATQQLLQERVTQDVRLRVMTHAAGLDLGFFEGSKSYDLLRQAQQEAANRPVSIVSAAFGLVQFGIMFVSMIALLVVVSPWLALIAVFAPVPAFIADARYGHRSFLLSTLAAPARRRMDYLAGLVTTDTFAKEVAVFGLGPHFTRRFRLLGSSFYRRLRALVVSRQCAAVLWGTLSTVAGCATYLYIALQALNGHLTIGDLTLYIAAASSVQMAIQGMFQGLSSMYENNLYLDQLYVFLGTTGAIRAPRDPVTLPASGAASITFEDVWFRYPDADDYALRGVSFHLDPATVTAIVGRNDSGKSTVVKLMCRLYDPTAGRIRYDGVDVRDIDPVEPRARIGAMFQDYVTYQATAAENIGVGEVSDIENQKAIMAAAGRAGALTTVAALPDGLNTMLGRWFGRGAELSGGQWQKIALARAFMRDSSLLVLDEPSAALDPAAEAELFAGGRDLAQGRTTVYVSHRFSTVTTADRILVLNGGELVESGTHQELMAGDGAYANLFNVQAAPYRM